MIVKRWRSAPWCCPTSRFGSQSPSENFECLKSAAHAPPWLRGAPPHFTRPDFFAPDRSGNDRCLEHEGKRSEWTAFTAARLRIT